MVENEDVVDGCIVDGRIWRELAEVRDGRLKRLRVGAAMIVVL